MCCYRGQWECRIRFVCYVRVCATFKCYSLVSVRWSPSANEPKMRFLCLYFCTVFMTNRIKYNKHYIVVCVHFSFINLFFRNILHDSLNYVLECSGVIVSEQKNIVQIYLNWMHANDIKRKFLLFFFNFYSSTQLTARTWDEAEHAKHFLRYFTYFFSHSLVFAFIAFDSISNAVLDLRPSEI